MGEPDDNDDEMNFAYLEIVVGGDPGHLGDDEPTIQPLCTECVRGLPDGDDGLCGFCRAVI
ncbi:hypothetical protein A4G26_04875 [Mycobacterium kansasii]|uniref:Uncharacterized protein n=1 Tax=Mycobacterium innocens TaxID=2341083 RepID=A0A498Q2B5_9MYCO|nr:MULTISPECIES: hypothetical protein [Mycobacterium]KZS75730.1 hypothetical protein A4G26_04875 [Mycobacterium kansasii]VBA38010.1 hypothetical protein LAUMK13_01918 [Mycobacterium innocens]